MPSKTALLLSISLFFLLPLYAYLPLQVDSTLTCNGSLGDNIFTDGDFGSGVPNLVTVNPQIAPGYNYTTAVPPGDGFYTITNNTGAWPNLYPTWLELRDNSSDPNGYFMVVNASFEPGLFYEQQVDGLCGNTQYEFSVDIINLIKGPTTGHINPNVDMLLDDQVVLSTGSIGQTERWNNYSVVFCTGPNQTSMKLSIRNNAPGGTGNDLALDNILFRPCGPDAVVSPGDTSYVCVDDTDEFLLTATISDPAFQAVRWQRSTDDGVSWQDLPNGDQLTFPVTNFASGTYLYRYLLATDNANLNNVTCRLISAEKTLIVVPILYSQTDTICDGNSYFVGNSVYTQTGIYVDSLISSIGCDSIVTTDLTVLPRLQTEPVYTVQSPNCFGGSDGSIVITDVPDGYPPFSYILNGVDVNATGIFTDLPADTYQVIVTDKFDCDFPATVVVPPQDPFIVTVPEDTSISFGETLLLSSFSSITNVNYSWTPAEGLSCSDCPDPIASPPSTTEYLLVVTDDKGCTARDSLTVEVTKANFLVHAPTAFTPNGDGQNDIFHVVARSPAGIRQIRKFSVFNRWGRIIYTTDGPAAGQNVVSWNGTSNGKFAPQGVYVFVIEMELIDDRVLQYSGTISLLR